MGLRHKLSPKSIDRPSLRPWVHIGHVDGFRTRSIDVPLTHLPPALDRLRIASISDLHIRGFWSRSYDRLIERLRAIDPHLLLVLGDIVHDKKSHRSAMPHVRSLLQQMSAPLGVYTILGNHDNLVMGAELSALGHRILHGEREVLRAGDAQLELIGAPGPMREHLPPDFAARFGPPQPGAPRIVLAHFPDHWKHLQSLDPDIYIAGHTHAGQVCLPNGMPLMRHDRMPRALCRGYHRFGRTHYFVNHGFGFSQFRLRLFCPAEVLVLTLRQTRKDA